MEQTNTQMDGSLIAKFMDQNEQVAHVYTEDEFIFQVKEWKDGIFYVNYAGGYQKNPKGYPNEFFGNTIASIQNGRIHMNTYNSKVIKARKIMNMVAEKFGMEIMN